MALSNPPSRSQYPKCHYFINGIPCGIGDCPSYCGPCWAYHHAVIEWKRQESSARREGSNKED